MLDNSDRTLSAFTLSVSDENVYASTVQMLKRSTTKLLEMGQAVSIEFHGERVERLR